MKLPKNDSAISAESLTQQFSAESQGGISKEPVEVADQDVSQSDNTCIKCYFFQHLL